MFDAIGKEVTLRILEGRELLSLVVSGEKPSDLSDRARRTAAMCKGLLFVQLYGTYEFAVSSSVRAALNMADATTVSCSELRRSLLSLVLDPLWVSVSDVGRKASWGRRLKLIEAMGDDGPMENWNDAVFPNSGSQFREEQLITIWRIFGIDAPTLPEFRLRERIEEVINNRNAIAHGRLAAREVGGRYSEAEMNERIDDIDAVSHYVIDAMKVHCAGGGLKLARA